MDRGWWSGDHTGEVEREGAYLHKCKGTWKASFATMDQSHNSAGRTSCLWVAAVKEVKPQIAVSGPKPARYGARPVGPGFWMAGYFDFKEDSSQFLTPSPQSSLKPRSPTLQADSLPSEPPGKSNKGLLCIKMWKKAVFKISNFAMKVRCNKTLKRKASDSHNTLCCFIFKEKHCAKILEELLEKI